MNGLAPKSDMTRPPSGVMLRGKENVIAAMREGARLFLGGYAKNNRLQYEDGRVRRVHGKTVQSVLDTGLVMGLNLDPWSQRSQEYVLKETDRLDKAATG